MIAVQRNQNLPQESGISKKNFNLRISAFRMLAQGAAENGWIEQRAAIQVA